MAEINSEKWNDFIKRLDPDDEFDGLLINYLNAIEFIALISVEEIDDPGMREQIDENLKHIVWFVEKYKDTWHEVGQIKGFRTNPKEADGSWKIRGRDYYYYIADQKIKAAVYYVRYHSFIEKHYNEDESVEQALEKLISSVAEKLSDKRINVDKSNVIDIIDDRLEDSEDSRRLRRDCLECIEKIRTRDIAYLKYMLFNNMMREIRFVGGSYQYLWHWRKRKQTLYRSGEIRTEPIRWENNKEKRIKEMFQTSIDHMNDSKGKLNSYSEQPLLDIYKYLILEKDENYKTYITIEIGGENAEQAEAEYDDNNKTVEFYILKNADINCIFQGGDALSFHDYITKDDCSEEFSFSVEMYPKVLVGEKNDKGTTIGLRDIYLPSYFASWGINGNLRKTKVADDKEVIAYGEYYRKLAVLDADLDAEDVQSENDTSALYKMTLQKKEIILLILKIGEKRFPNVVEEITSHLVVSMDDRNRNRFGNMYRDKAEGSIQGGIFLNVKLFDFNANIHKAFYEELRQDNKWLAVYDARNQVLKKIKEEIGSVFKEHYKAILDSFENNRKVKFILDNITDTDYDFDLVRQYNEYKKDMEDCEIAALKSIIFG